MDALLISLWHHQASVVSLPLTFPESLHPSPTLLFLLLGIPMNPKASREALPISWNLALPIGPYWPYVCGVGQGFEPAQYFDPRGKVGVGNGSGIQKFCMPSNKRCIMASSWE